MVGAIGGANGYGSYGNYGDYAGGYKNSPAGSQQGNQRTEGIPGVRESKDGSVREISKDKERCQTCAKRKYQDGSNENVSFKAAAHISPEAAGSAVRAHEGEHVSNAYTKAAQKDGKVISASVSIHTSVCPECGKTYVSGGTTSTRIKYPVNPYEESRKTLGAEEAKGKNIDYAA
ncbi:MAG: hypothetical protein HFH49_13655 [Lachnospiraceae bacterium]|nr:hypothetical protein [Lachnospiraceae bacterium]